MCVTCDGDNPGRIWCPACGGDNLHDDEDGHEYCCARCGDGDGLVPCPECATFEAERDEANRLRKELAVQTDRMLTAEAALGAMAAERDRLADKNAQINGLLVTVTDLRDLLAAKDAEIALLRYAARSRLKCPEGHKPGESRGACWFCDAEANAADLAALRAAVGELPEYPDENQPTWIRSWGIQANTARAAARKLAGLG